MGSSLLAALLLFADAGDIDLAKLPRNIAPPKDAKAPKYCCLVFGERAERIVWLALDDKTLYIDRNSDGRFDGPDEKVAAKVTEEGAVLTFEAGDLPISKLDPAEVTLRVTRQPQAQDRVNVWVRIRRDGAPSAEPDRRYECFAGPEDREGLLSFAATPTSAPILHFGGPWTLFTQDRYKVAKGRDVECYLCVGTKGLGPGSFVSVGVQDGAPEKAAPVVKFLSGGPSIRIMHRC